MPMTFDKKSIPPVRAMRGSVFGDMPGREGDSGGRPMPHAHGHELPDHVQRFADGGQVGYSCRHCGGDVGEEGTATSLYDESTEPDYEKRMSESPDTDTGEPDDDVKAQFAKAVRDRRFR